MSVDILDAGDLAGGNAADLGDLSFDVWRLDSNRLRLSAHPRLLLLRLGLSLVNGLSIRQHINSDQFSLSFDFLLIFFLSFSGWFCLIWVLRLLLWHWLRPSGNLFLLQLL